MIDDESIEQLLKWRLAQAESAAPPTPRAARLIELARPWWETAPEQFQALWARLGPIQVGYGHALAEPRAPRGGGYPVPALIVRAGETEVETAVRVLYLGIRDGRMSFRFHLEARPEPADAAFEVTFVADESAQPLFSAQATRSVDSEYRLDAELTGELARAWGDLRVMDRMPFRLILHWPVQAG
jgi:hypothetical protein